MQKSLPLFRAEKKSRNLFSTLVGGSRTNWRKSESEFYLQYTVVCKTFKIENPAKVFLFQIKKFKRTVKKINL